MLKTKTLWKGEHLSVVSPEDIPYEAAHHLDGVFVLPIIGDKFIIRKEFCPPYMIKDDHDEPRKFYTVVSGGIEEGEDPEQTMLRELKEETGFVLKDDYDVLYHKKMPFGKGHDVWGHFYIIKVSSYDRIPIENDGSEYEDKSDSLVVNVDRMEQIMDEDNVDFFIISLYNMYKQLK